MHQSHLFIIKIKVFKAYKVQASKAAYSIISNLYKLTRSKLHKYKKTILTKTSPNIQLKTYNMFSFKLMESLTCNKESFK